MKIESSGYGISWGWIAFWFALAAIIIASMFAPKGEDPNKAIIEACVANKGIPVYDQWQSNKIIDCKTYK